MYDDDKMMKKEGGGGVWFHDGALNEGSSDLVYVERTWDWADSSSSWRVT